MLKTAKEKRADIFRDSRFQMFLNKFLSGELQRLDPVYDPKYGYRYPEVEAIIGDPVDTEKFLKHLYEMGFLTRELYDKIIYCPACDSSDISTRYRCPYCKTFDIKKSSLIEHVSCGYIDTEERFRKKDKLICPKCGLELTKLNVNYRKAGVWCSCNECGKTFDIPIPSHFCRECTKSFMFEDAKYRNVYSYSLNEAVIRDAGARYMLVSPVKKLLQNRGFHVESPGFLKGKSGASHVFDILASRDEEVKQIIVIDLASSPTKEAVSEQSVISMFAKVFDTTPDRAYLIAIPRISENGKKLADLYKINLIEAEDQDSAIEALDSSLS